MVRIAHHAHRSRTWLVACAAVLLLAACGGGGAASTPAASGTPLLATTTIVVTADLDGDGRGDVLELTIDADADAPMRCWRALADGGFDELPGDLPSADAIRDDLQRLPDHRILADEGAHQAPTDGGTLPYVVLHLEREDDAPAGEPGPPVIDALLPARGQAGALVGIVGSDLTARDARTTVRFDDLEARVLLALPRFVLTLVPERAPLGALDVVVARGTAASLPATFTVVERPTPRLDSVRPAPLVPGVLAVLRGADLGTPAGDVSVTFGGAAARHVLALGSVLFAEVPEAAVSGRVFVTVDGVTSNGVEAEVATALDAPTLTRVTPAAASAGSLVRIAGEDLFVIGQAPRVLFGTKPAAVFGVERGALVVIVPSGADGDVQVTVGDRSSNALAFELLRRGTPTITMLDPASGEPGDAIDILGTDLHDLSGLGADTSPATLAARLPRVAFGGTRAWFVLPIVGGLRVVVPFSASAGAADVTVTLGDAESDSASFTVR